MNKGKERLRSLLFVEGRDLGNVKFFPGTAKDLSADQLADAAADALQVALDAWKSGVPSQPPVTGLPKRAIFG